MYLAWRGHVVRANIEPSGADMLSVTFMIHKFRYTPPFRIVCPSKLPVTYARHHEAAGRDDLLAMESLSW